MVGRPNGFCFTITEISLLWVGLFHDPTPSNDICDTKFLHCLGPRIEQKWQHLLENGVGSNHPVGVITHFSEKKIPYNFTQRWIPNDLMLSTDFPLSFEFHILYS